MNSENNNIVYTFENISGFEFNSMTEIRDAIKECAQYAGFAVSTRSSRSSYLFMACYHYGASRSPKTADNFGGSTAPSPSALKPRERLSQKQGCPFAVKASPREKPDGSVVWRTTSISVPDAHNHPIAKNVYSYPMNRHTKTADQKRQVLQMLQSFATNTSIARTMNAAGVGMTPKDVANFRNDMNTFLKGNDEIKNLILDLESNGYTVAYSVSAAAKGKKTLKCIFFTHESGISLARRFNEVMIVDATYNTNRSKLPFVNVVGVSNVGYPNLMSFGIAGGWIIDETVDSYEWFVKQLKHAIWKKENTGPSIIITDSEQALLKPLMDFFPDSKKKLCHAHLRRNFKTKLLSYFNDYEEIEKSINYMMCTDFDNKITGLKEAVLNDQLFKKGIVMYEKEAKENSSDPKTVVNYLNL